MNKRNNNNNKTNKYSQVAPIAKPIRETKLNQGEVLNNSRIERIEEEFSSAPTSRIQSIILIIMEQ